jgi:hypothetical protein
MCGLNFTDFGFMRHMLKSLKSLGAALGAPLVVEERFEDH